MSTQQDAPGRRSAWRPRLSGIVAIASILALVFGVGAAEAQQSGHSSTPPVTAHPSVVDRVGPPPIRFSSSGTSLLIRPYTSCWSDDNGGVCYDGRPPQPPPSLGETFGAITMSFAADSWHFSVTATDKSGHHTKVKLIPLDGRRWRLDLSGMAAGRYRLDIFGNGPQGDVAAAGGFTISSLR